MGQVTLVPLLPLALPTAALANSSSFFYFAGSSEITPNVPAGGPWTFVVVGQLNTIIVFTPLVFETPEGVIGFSTGTVIVKDSAGVTVFKNSLSNGEFGFHVDGFTGDAQIVPNAEVISGSVSFGATLFGPGCDPECSLAIFVSGSRKVPEPSAVEGLLLGTGLLGLVEMARRKLKFGV